MPLILWAILFANIVSPALSPPIAEAAENTTLQPQTLEVSDLQNIALSDAQEYNLSTKQTSRFMATLTCESGWSATSTSPTGDFGIAQWHIEAHGMTEAQAFDPVYSLRQMALAWYNGHADWWVCYNKLYGKTETL